MTALFWLIIFIGAFIALAYQRIGLKTTTVTAAGLLLACTLTSTGFGFGLLLWLVFGVIAAPLNVAALRMPLITRPILNRFRAVVPTLPATERVALDAGTLWWEGELFSGKPNWRRLDRMPPPRLSDDEQAFLDGPVQQLLDLCDEWRTTREETDLTRQAWQFIQDNKFFGLIIPKCYGGLELSAYAHSCVLAKIGSGPGGATVGPIVAAPNSLGPAELLLRYGTDAQKDHYLPRLAAGEEIPSFGLTGPYVGSDAGAIPDTGVVCKGEWHGAQILGMKLTWNKRSITLAPVATILGLTFELRDPDSLLGVKRELGVTCALVPSTIEGVHAGRRHLSTDAPFPDGPTWGDEVFVPLDFIIGGREMIGQGWRMLMECLPADRAISLPAGAAGAAIANARLTGAYAVVRHQFGVSVGGLECVQQALARIGARTYACESVRGFTANAVDLGEKPLLASAIAEYQAATLAREVARDALDVHASKAVMRGLSNPPARRCQAAPVNISGEGANTLTRLMMPFGVGAIRCHPYLLAEIEAAGNGEHSTALDAFDKLIHAHVGHDLAAAARSLVMGVTGGWATAAGEAIALKPYYQAMNRYSANLALLSDIALTAFGGHMKCHESIAARLADVISNLYLASATLKRFNEDGACAEDLPFVQWVCKDAFASIEAALAGVVRHLPHRAAAWLAGMLIFPLGRGARVSDDALGRRIATLVQQPGTARDRLTPRCYKSQTKNEGVALFDRVMQATLDCAELQQRLVNARAQGTINADHPREQIEQAATAGVLSAEEAQRMHDLYKLQMAVADADDFNPAELPPVKKPVEKNHRRGDRTRPDIAGLSQRNQI